MSSATITIHTHYQLSEYQREHRGCNDYLNDRSYSTRKKASYLKLDNRRRTSRGNGFRIFGPGWLMPRVLATVTASIVWGTCGAMADMPEY